MIEIVGFELAYCNQCHFPAWCGVLRLCAWKHNFRLCSHCLTTLAESIDARMPQRQLEELDGK